MKLTPTAQAQINVAYEKLKQVRASKTVSLKPTPMMRQEIVGYDKQPVPLKLRYYQSQGIYHLLMMKRMVLGDGTGLGKCVTGDTLLTTDQGLIPISSLAPPEDLQPDTFYEPAFPAKVWVNGKLVPVRRFYWNGEAPAYQLRTRDGYVVMGSGNHPVLVRGPEGEGFVKLPEIEPIEQYACIERRGTFAQQSPAIPFEPHVGPNAARYEVPSHLTPQLARLLGYIVAEGTVTGEYRTVITQHREVNPETHDDIRRLLKAVFGWENNHTSANRDQSIEVTSIQLRQYFAACGVDYTTARQKSVPWAVMQGTREEVQEFLRGLFDAEASVVSGGVEFSTASRRLSQEVQLLLLNLGICSTRKPKYVKGYDHTYWRITLFGDSAERFASQIGFVSLRKQTALEASLPTTRNPNKDVVPHARELLERVREALMAQVSVEGANDARKGSGLRQFGENFQSKLKHVRSGNRNPTYAFLREVYAACETVAMLDHPAVQELRSVLHNGYYYDPIVSVEEAGVEPLMDIEVDDPAHTFAANGFVNHNTCQTIGALCYLWDKEPDNRVIVVSPKAALRQWESEIHKFATGIKVFVVTGSAEERKQTYLAWAAYKGPDKPVMIINYHLLVRDWDVGGGMQPDPTNPKKKVFVAGLLNGITEKLQNLVVVYDEATAFKNTGTKTFQTCEALSHRASRCYGLTATLLKNNLMEGFSIFKVVVPWVFSTKTKFIENYAVTRLQRVAGGRQVPLVVGYRNLEHFREMIDPYFLGRPKHVVSDELPVLITKEITCEMTPVEDRKYGEALSGILELGDGTVKDYEESKALVALIYCQQVVNSLAMLKFQEGDEITAGLFKDESLKVESMGSKESALVELLTEELDGEKVIIYTRFESLVGRLQTLLNHAKIKSTRITGKESGDKRKVNQDAFQDPDSGTNVIFITDAGSEAINLQSASALVFYDAPWSWGNYVQTLGRPVRIGSKHSHVVVYHLMAERPREKRSDRKTIDHHVLELLRGKKRLSDAVLGEATVGALDFEKETKGGARDLVRRLQNKGEATDG